MKSGDRGGRVSAFIKQFAFLSCLFAAIAVMLGYSVSVLTDVPDTDASVSPAATAPTVVIDAGHGGEDGGAVGYDGTLEKDLNLEYAKTLHEMCKLLGISSVLTRDTDEMLYARYADTDHMGKKKLYDLKNRLRFTEEAGDRVVFVGIHMNKFPQSKYSGAQIYYSPNSPQSRLLAEGIRSAVKEKLQPENNREIKRAGTSIYLLNRLRVPAVLAECGFLSNPEETERLKEGVYRKEFSLTAAAAIGEFIRSEE